MFEWNLMVHMRRHNKSKNPAINFENYLESFCIDSSSYTYLVHSGSSGPTSALHIQKKLQYYQPHSYSAKVINVFNLVTFHPHQN